MLEWEQTFIRVDDYFINYVRVEIVVVSIYVDILLCNIILEGLIVVWVSFSVGFDNDSNSAIIIRAFRAAFKTYYNGLIDFTMGPCASNLVTLIQRKAQGLCSHALRDEVRQLRKMLRCAHL
jgi:sRNA-binding regulator protein Hfq